MMINGSRGISMRADDVDVTGDAYRSVRIEEFGRGMLRGMGWPGSRRTTRRDGGPRGAAARVGAGAAPKLPRKFMIGEED